MRWGFEDVNFILKHILASYPWQVLCQPQMLPSFSPGLPDYLAGEHRGGLWGEISRPEHLGRGESSEPFESKNSKVSTADLGDPDTLPSLHLCHWPIHSTAQGSTLLPFPASSPLDHPLCSIGERTPPLDPCILTTGPSIHSPAEWERTAHLPPLPSSLCSPCSSLGSIFFLFLSKFSWMTKLGLLLCVHPRLSICF